LRQSRRALFSGVTLARVTIEHAPRELLARLRLRGPNW
jgi:hypothetical protein